MEIIIVGLLSKPSNIMIKPQISRDFKWQARSQAITPYLKILHRFRLLSEKEKSVKICKRVQTTVGKESVINWGTCQRDYLSPNHQPHMWKLLFRRKVLAAFQFLVWVSSSHGRGVWGVPSFPEEGTGSLWGLGLSIPQVPAQTPQAGKGLLGRATPWWELLQGSPPPALMLLSLLIISPRKL